MALRSFTQYHNHVGSYATTELPNVSGATVQDPNIEVGDIAYDTTEQVLKQCTDDTLSAAVWDTTGGDLHTPSIIVGNQAAGDTLAVCDVLDTGNGTVLKAAIEGMSAGEYLFIREGTYNFGAASGPTASIEIQQGTRIGGAGPGTIIRNRPDGVQQIFTSVGSLEGVILENMKLLVTLPTGAGSGATSLVQLDGLQFTVRGIDVEWDGGFTGTEAADLVLRESLDCVGGHLIDCRVQNPPALSGLLSPPGEHIGIEATRIERCRSEDGDVAFEVRGLMTGSVATGYDTLGVRCQSGAGIVGCEITGGASGASGIDCGTAQNAYISGNQISGSGTGNVGITAAFQTKIIGNYIQNFDEGIVTTQPNGVIEGNTLDGMAVRSIDVIAGDDNTVVVGNNHVGVSATPNGIRVAADECIVNNNRVLITSGTGIEFTAASNNCVCIGNIAKETAGTAISDAGTGNELAHNLQL
jgi:hypothetical protein